MSKISETKYFAYGSNLSFSQMNKRCPDNIRLNVGRLNGYRWIISNRGYANVIKSENDFVLGAFARMEKFKEPFLNFVKKLLNLNDNIKLIIAGPNNSDLISNELQYFIKIMDFI